VPDDVGTAFLHFDLAIVAAVLAADGVFGVGELAGTVLRGELGLNGCVRTWAWRLDGLAASVRAADALPRYVWTEDRPDPASYVRTIQATISERQRWRAQYRRSCGYRFGNWSTG